MQLGYTKSCGCIHKEVCTTHSLSHHRLYKTWKAMIERCENNILKNYKDYGARGIKVCDRWLDIKNFIEDMYPTYEEGLSLDRINVNGNYEPKNCRWATASTQMRNKRKIQTNNTSGYRGVSFSKKADKWRALITINCKGKHLGFYPTAFRMRNSIRHICYSK